MAASAKHLIEKSIPKGIREEQSSVGLFEDSQAIIFMQIRETHSYLCCIVSRVPSSIILIYPDDAKWFRAVRKVRIPSPPPNAEWMVFGKKLSGARSSRRNEAREMQSSATEWEEK